MKLFGPQTEKWFKLRDNTYGYLRKAGYLRKTSSFEEAIEILNKINPSKSSSKICLKETILAIKNLKKTQCYEIVSYICAINNLNSYGGDGHILFIITYTSLRELV